MTVLASVQDLRAMFPILETQVHGHPLVYLDNAATAQKPEAVLHAIAKYYRHENANVHRGVHELAARATQVFEAARTRVAQFIGARNACEIIFTQGTTEAINLVAHSWGGTHLGPGDEILLSAMEHHANLVPWQLCAQRTGARLRIIPLRAGEHLDEEAFETLLGERTRLVAMVHASNAIGRLNPVARICRKAHALGACVLLDGAQAVPHVSVDVAKLGVDFYTFSGHKLYGPMGIGVLYGRESLLEAMPPYQSGGEMIKDVSFEHTTFNDLPHKFEAGTPNVAAAAGLAAAIDWLMGEAGGYDALAVHEDALRKRCVAALQRIEGLRLFAPEGAAVSVCSFVVEGVHAYDLGQLLDARGFALRTGHHCAQPLMGCLGITGCLRASFACYNTEEEVEALACELVRALARLR